MRRSLVLAVVLSLIAAGTIAPAEAGKRKPKRVQRTVKLTYDHPGIGVAPLGGYPVNFPEGSSEIATGPNDLFFKIKVEDASGQPVWGFISQGDLDGNGVNDDGYGQFCGAHQEFLPVAKPGAAIIGIYAYSGACDSGGHSMMTSGTIKVIFTNVP